MAIKRLYFCQVHYQYIILFMKLPLYIHIPFCRKKCNYCGFFSQAYSSAPAEKLIDVYRKQIEGFLRQGISFNYIYIGGGTPSVLEGKLLWRLLNSLKRFSPEEFSFEANPESLSLSCLKILQEGGVNRLSIGVQTFSHPYLTFLGRLHTPYEAQEAVENAYKVGFRNLNIDLIFALPGQNINEVLKDLKKALRLPLAHLSLYALIYEPHTPLYRLLQRGEIGKLEEEKEAEMYKRSVEFLESRGFLRYEVSNFAREGFSCRHNINYWQDLPYLALGPSAVYFYQNRRYRYISNIASYIEKAARGGELWEFVETIKGEKYAREKAAFNIRLAGGIDLEEFEKTTGFDLLLLASREIKELRRQKLVSLAKRRLRLTAQGFLFADYVSRKFV